jgi:ParB-like chromosome segregation protein Spo0J
MNYKVERGVKLLKTQITPNDYNPNKTTQRQQEAIAESLEKYGQLLEIVVRPDPNNKGKYLIIDGEHRYNELDDEVFVNVVHGLSDADAKKLTVIFNETRGEADPIELANLLASLQDELDDLGVGLPYTKDELNDLLSQLEENVEDDDDPDFDPVDDSEQPRLDELKLITCPSCGHQFNKEDG